jgi:hypothetical protein
MLTPQPDSLGFHQKPTRLADCACAPTLAVASRRQANARSNAPEIPGRAGRDNDRAGENIGQPLMVLMRWLQLS